MNERVKRAVTIGKRVSFVINLQLIIGAVLAASYLILIRGEAWWRILAYCVGGVAFSLLFWFTLPFALAFAFPPPPDRLEFPRAGWIVWPLVAVATLATILLVVQMG